MLPGLAPSPKSPNAQLLRGAPHPEDRVIALLLAMTIIGIVEVASVLVMSVLHRRGLPGRWLSSDKVAIPYTRRRWPGPPSDPAEERARPG
jgi:hypothetical protein